MNKVKSEGVEILIGSKGYIDFAFPVYMTQKQIESFMNLLKKIYDPRVILEKRVDVFKRDWRIGERVLYPREWTAEEYLVLFECELSEKAYELLGRSWYATELKDADWRYKLISFCDKHGYDLSKEDKLEIIKKFMKAQEEFKKMRKDLRKEKKELEGELNDLDSPETKKRLTFAKQMGQISDDDIIKIESKKEKTEARLKEIKEELEKSIDEI